MSADPVRRALAIVDAVHTGDLTRYRELLPCACPDDETGPSAVRLLAVLAAMVHPDATVAELRAAAEVYVPALEADVGRRQRARSTAEAVEALRREGLSTAQIASTLRQTRRNVERTESRLRLVRGAS